jgi:hypothetical protein
MITGMHKQTDLVIVQNGVEAVSVPVEKVLVASRIEKPVAT